jgi:hypothetical protein
VCKARDCFARTVGLFKNIQDVFLEGFCHNIYIRAPSHVRSKGMGRKDFLQIYKTIIVYSKKGIMPDRKPFMVSSHSRPCEATAFGA